MKTLTICQPYAHLIVIGQKFVENRTWPTTYRGPLLIHAGKSREWLETDDSGLRPEKLQYGIPLADMPFGAIVGIAELAACMRKQNILDNAKIDPAKCPGWDWKSLAEHGHTEGPWCWVLRNVRRFATPIPYKGAMGLFEVPASVFVVSMEALRRVG